jgi:hypothetical protein
MAWMPVPVVDIPVIVEPLFVVTTTLEPAVLLELDAFMPVVATIVPPAWVTDTPAPVELALMPVANEPVPAVPMLTFPESVIAPVDELAEMPVALAAVPVFCVIVVVVALPICAAIAPEPVAVRLTPVPAVLVTVTFPPSRNTFCAPLTVETVSPDEPV